MTADLDALAPLGPWQRWTRQWLGARSTAASRGALALGLTAVFALLAWVLGLAVHERREVRRGEAALARMEQRPVGKPAGKTGPALTAQQAASVDQVVDRLNLPWARMLDDLERYTPPEVAVLQMEPDVGSGNLTLLVEAKSAQDVFLYLDALKAARSLRRVRIVKYETNVQDAARPARFVLQAEIAREASAEAASGSAR